MKVGQLIVNWGSMYSGKTEELLRLMKRAKFAGKKYQIFKPRLDNRYSDEQVVTHYGQGMKPTVVEHSTDILNNLKKDVSWVGIDEGQFFDKDLIEVIKKMKAQGINVVVSGLDMWASGEIIELMCILAGLANESKKFHAVCVSCGEDAYISHRTVEVEGNIAVGSKGMYVALCEDCWANK